MSKQLGCSHTVQMQLKVKCSPGYYWFGMYMHNIVAKEVNFWLECLIYSYTLPKIIYFKSLSLFSIDFKGFKNYFIFQQTRLFFNLKLLYLVRFRYNLALANTNGYGNSHVPKNIQISIWGYCLVVYILS